MLVAPSEPLPLRRLGQVSSVPERHGVDFLWVSQGAKCGVQRKEVKDFVASVIDGRLAKEVAQMRQLGPVRALVIEGQFVWTVEGQWLGPVRWDRFRWRQALYTLMAQGVWVINSESIPDTAEAVTELERWTKKPKHSFARARGAATGSWGTPTSREFACYLLQGLPGVGPELAERIYDTLGLPWTWTVGEQELRAVDGIGPKRAAQMLAALPGRMEEKVAVNGVGA